MNKINNLSAGKKYNLMKIVQLNERSLYIFNMKHIRQIIQQFQIAHTFSDIYATRMLTFYLEKEVIVQS